MNLNIDGHKLNYHPERVAAWAKGENIYPVYVEIGITSACNHRCIFCALDFIEGKGHSIETSVLLETLTEMGKQGVKSIMFGGEGEPTLHKDFCLIVKHAKESGLDVALTTNGVPFTKKIAELCLPYMSWIKFSIDAGTKETYAKIHNTSADDFDKLLANIQDAVIIKNKNNCSVRIGAQILLIEENVQEAILLAKKVKELGVDYFVIKPYSQHPHSSNKFAVDYSRFEKLKEQLELLTSNEFKVIFRMDTMNKLKEEVNYDTCHGLSFFTLIDAAGNVIPCNLFYGKKEYYYGNLYKNSFEDIWGGEKRMSILQNLCKEGTSKCRENCRLDTINRYLFSLKNPPEHVNFI